jgi:hypothetical protein
MNELKRRQGLKQESLINFHRASLQTTFPFEKLQALSTNLRDYLTSAGRSRGLPLFSNLQRWWSNTTVVKDYYISGGRTQSAPKIMVFMVYVGEWRGGFGGGIAGGRGSRCRLI